MSIKLSRRALTAFFTLLALAVCAVHAYAAQGFKAITITGGSEGALIIDVREKQGALVIRQGSYAVASLSAPKKKWQRVVDAWHQAQAAADEGRPLLVSVKMTNDKRLTIEVGAKVLLTFVEETSSHSFTIYPQDYEVLNSALEAVLSHLED